MRVEIKSALLVGASGLVGSELLTIILQSPAYDRVKIFVRKKVRFEHPKLEQILIDFNHLEAYDEHLKVNDVYCCLGTTIKKAGTQQAFKKVDFEYPIRLAQLAKRNGVQKFLIITALGANEKSKVFYSRVKGEVEEEIKEIGLPTFHIFQPSLLLGNRKEFRFGEWLSILCSPLFSLVMIGGLRKYRPILARNVACAMYSVGQTELTGIYTYESDQIKDLSHKNTLGSSSP
jgi:uncharacterized protein YbjT (DUF2867 family)